jgi:site-specific DNA-methyltransferase (adenine-specific)
MDSNLVNDDCIAYFAQIGDHAVDLVIVDPPYGTTQCKYDTIIDIDAMWKELRRIVKPSGAIVVFSKMPFTAKLVSSNIDAFYQEYIWVKNVGANFLNAGRMALDFHENIIVFKASKQRIVYNPQLIAGKPYKVKRTGKDDSGECYGKIKQRTDTNNTGTRNPTTVLHYDRVPNNVRCHPSQKPCTLLDFLVLTYSNEGDTVLDFAMGSGSTGRSALTHKRKFVGIEKDKDTFDLAVRRLSVSEEEWNIHIKSTKIKKRSPPVEETEEQSSKRNKQDDE